MQQGWNPQGGAPGGTPYGQAQGVPGQQPGAPGQVPGGYGQAPPGYGQAPGAYGQPPAGAPQMQGMGGPVPAAPAAAGSKLPGFVSGLFDFSFNTFVTTKVIKVLYGIWMLMVAGIVLFGLYGAVDTMFLRHYTRPVEGFIMLIVTPIAAALYLILGRVYMEVLIVMFRIAENLSELNRKTKDANAPGD